MITLVVGKYRNKSRPNAGGESAFLDKKAIPLITDARARQVFTELCSDSSSAPVLVTRRGTRKVTLQFGKADGTCYTLSMAPELAKKYLASNTGAKGIIGNNGTGGPGTGSNSRAGEPATGCQGGISNSGASRLASGVNSSLDKGGNAVLGMRVKVTWGNNTSSTCVIEEYDGSTGKHKGEAGQPRAVQCGRCNTCALDPHVSWDALKG